MNNPLSPSRPAILAVLIVAGGSGTRMGGDVPKQYRRLAGERVLTRTVRAFLGHPAVSHVQVVIDPDHADYYREATEGMKFSAPVNGGQSRQQSVERGLRALEVYDPDAVLIHDAARPLVSADLIDRVAEGLRVSAAVAPALAITDTLKVRAGDYVRTTLDRNEFAVVQTPQGFNYRLILAAHVALSHKRHSDDAALVEQMGGQVLLVQGDPANIKLTTTHDWRLAEALLLAEGAP